MIEDSAVQKVVETPHDEVAVLTAQDVETARSALTDMLRRSKDGAVSAQALRKVLEKLGVNGVEEAIEVLRFKESQSPNGERIYWKGRSFLTADAYQRSQDDAEKRADAAALQAKQQDPPAAEEPPPKQKRENRQEEAKLCTYIRDALEDIYASEVGPGYGVPYAFDIHNERAGTDYENVDLLAVDWRTRDIAEIIAVEAKLEFSAKLLQQAANYTRFADRVWIAVPVQAHHAEAAASLRESDSRLFDHAVALGLGILACRRAVGNSYDVAPIQWPRLTKPSRLERAHFIRRHQETLEEARAVPPSNSLAYPKL